MGAQKPDGFHQFLIIIHIQRIHATVHTIPTILPKKIVCACRTKLPAPEATPVFDPCSLAIAGLQRVRQIRGGLDKFCGGRLRPPSLACSVSMPTSFSVGTLATLDILADTATCRYWVITPHFLNTHINLCNATRDPLFGLRVAKVGQWYVSGTLNLPNIDGITLH